jgi:regulator of replication initiation timing
MNVLCDGADVHEIRLREAVRKARTETEEEYREKIRTSERRSLEEADALRAEIALVKRKLEETQREADNAKRKITLSKQDGKAEAQAEVLFQLYS